MEGQFFFNSRRSQPNLPGRSPMGPILKKYFWNFPEFQEKTISRGDLGQYLLEKFSSRCWIRRGVISCSPHTSFDEINHSVVNSERGELVRGSAPRLVYKRSLYGRWFVAGADQATVKITFGGWGVENWDKTFLSPLDRRRTEFWEDVTEGHRTTQATSHALGHGSR